MDFINDANYLDQHFLINEDIIKKIITFTNLSKEDEVLEIGPGVGTLTKLIAPNVKSLTVIEKDERLAKYLKEIPKIKIIWGDAIKTPYPKCNKIITSLPYSIIEPFIYKLKSTNFKELYMIMGQNYVDSVLNKEITNLSLLTNTYFALKELMTIAPDAFNPKPRVMSKLVKITPKKDKSALDVILETLYDLDAKLIKNSLLEAFIKLNNITKKESKIIVLNLNLPEEILNKQFNLISNEELKCLYEKIYLYLNK